MDKQVVYILKMVMQIYGVVLTSTFIQLLTPDILVLVVLNITILLLHLMLDNNQEHGISLMLLLVLLMLQQHLLKECASQQMVMFILDRT